MRLGGGEGVAAARREWRRRPGSESARGRTQRFVGAVRRRGGPVKKAAAAPRVGVGVGGGWCSTLILVNYAKLHQHVDTSMWVFD